MQLIDVVDCSFQGDYLTINTHAALLNGAIATVMITLIIGLVLWLNRAAARIIAMEIATLDADSAID